MAQLNKFIKILLHCLENEQNNSILCWGEDDCGFQIVNLKEFKNLIFREFHIRNITSFVRQANLYGFKIRRNSDNKKEYHHPKFRRNSQDLIYQIQRVQKSKIKPNENDLTLKSIEITNSQLYADLQQLKIQQNLMHREIELNLNIQKQLQNNTQLLMKALIQPDISNAVKHITLIFEQFLKITGGLLPEFVDKITKFIFEGIYIDPQILYSPLPFV